ncbi:hypothetical protein Hanom_Chr03g00267391 [Helianthus anomalus]
MAITIILLFITLHSNIHFLPYFESVSRILTYHLHFYYFHVLNPSHGYRRIISTFHFLESVLRIQTFHSYFSFLESILRILMYHLYSHS